MELMGVYLKPCRKRKIEDVEKEIAEAIEYENRRKSRLDSKDHRPELPLTQW